MEKGWREVSSAVRSLGRGQDPAGTLSRWFLPLLAACGALAIPNRGSPIPVGAAQPQWCGAGSASSTLLAFEGEEEHPLGVKQSLCLTFCV